MDRLRPDLTSRTERLFSSMPALDVPSLTAPQLIKSNKKKHWKKRRNEALTYIVSAFYAKILVILGIALPVTDSIASEDYESYDAFYLYLYVGSIGFLIYTYIHKIRAKSMKNNWEYLYGRHPSTCDIHRKLSVYSFESNYIRYGSFYFRMGVTGFGIGSVIYSGLQFGQYFELSSEKDCDNLLKALKPLFRIAFALMQILFIFSYNNFVYAQKSKIIPIFGVMHMIATNICEWLAILVQETKHDIFTSAKELKANSTLSKLDEQFLNSKSFEITRQLFARNNECLKSRIMDSVLAKSEPYLAPCCVEYSFLCAVMLGLMWKNTYDNENKNESSSHNKAEIKEKQSGCTVIYSRRQSQFSVDCAQAHKGLFSGILVLAMTIISLIMFFELVSYKQYKDAAILQVNVWEATLFVTGTLAAVLCIMALRDISFRTTKSDLELEHLLLLVTQTGVFMYFLFQIIGGSFMGLNKGTGGLMRIITPLCALIQSCCQTVLIMDAWRRRCITLQQMRKKPGRQLITFLLVTNIALWIVNGLKNNRAFSHPNQMDFYGILAWNIITHVTMPLVVSYRFQATVCFYEIWKRVYKVRPINGSLDDIKSNYMWPYGSKKVWIGGLASISALLLAFITYLGRALMSLPAPSTCCLMAADGQIS